MFSSPFHTEICKKSKSRKCEFVLTYLMLIKTSYDEIRNFFVKVRLDFPKIAFIRFCFWEIPIFGFQLVMILAWSDYNILKYI